MENYADDGAAVLSKDNIASTDNLIATAIKDMPESAIAGIMPVMKTRGPATRWVEPYYQDDKFELIARDAGMDDNSNVYRLPITCVAVDDIRRNYTPEAFKELIQGWALFLRHKRQRKQLVEILTSPVVANLPAISTTSNYETLTEDKLESIRSQVVEAIQDLMKRFQLSEMDFSVIGPYKVAFAILEIQSRVPGKIHFLGEDEIDDIYVFPTGTVNASRSGLALFEYADSFQRAYDDSGNEVWFYHNRSRIALNPIHEREPIINRIELT